MESGKAGARVNGSAATAVVNVAPHRASFILDDGHAVQYVDKVDTQLYARAANQAVLKRVRDELVTYDAAKRVRASQEGKKIEEKETRINLKTRAFRDGVEAIKAAKDEIEVAFHLLEDVSGSVSKPFPGRQQGGSLAFANGTFPYARKMKGAGAHDTQERPDPFSRDDTPNEEVKNITRTFCSTVSRLKTSSAELGASIGELKGRMKKMRDFYSGLHFLKKRWTVQPTPAGIELQLCPTGMDKKVGSYAAGVRRDLPHRAEVAFAQHEQEVRSGVDLSKHKVEVYSNLTVNELNDMLMRNSSTMVVRKKRGEDGSFPPSSLSSPPPTYANGREEGEDSERGEVGGGSVSVLSPCSTSPSSLTAKVEEDVQKVVTSSAVRLFRHKTGSVTVENSMVAMHARQVHNQLSREHDPVRVNSSMRGGGGGLLVGGAVGVGQDSAHHAGGEHEGDDAEGGGESYESGEVQDITHTRWRKKRSKLLLYSPLRFHIPDVLCPKVGGEGGEAKGSCLPSLPSSACQENGGRETGMQVAVKVKEGEEQRKGGEGGSEGESESESRRIERAGEKGWGRGGRPKLIVTASFFECYLWKCRVEVVARLLFSRLHLATDLLVECKNRIQPYWCGEEGRRPLSCCSSFSASTSPSPPRSESGGEEMTEEELLCQLYARSALLQTCNEMEDADMPKHVTALFHREACELSMQKMDERVTHRRVLSTTFDSVIATLPFARLIGVGCAVSWQHVEGGEALAEALPPSVRISLTLSSGGKMAIRVCAGKVFVHHLPSLSHRPYLDIREGFLCLAERHIDPCCLVERIRLFMAMDAVSHIASIVRSYGGSATVVELASALSITIDPLPTELGEDVSVRRLAINMKGQLQLGGRWKSLGDVMLASDDDALSRPMELIGISVVGLLRREMGLKSIRLPVGGDGKTGYAGEVGGVSGRAGRLEFSP